MIKTLILAAAVGTASMLGLASNSPATALPAVKVDGASSAPNSTEARYGRSYGFGYRGNRGYGRHYGYAPRYFYGYRYRPRYYGYAYRPYPYGGYGYRGYGGGYGYGRGYW